MTKEQIIESISSMSVLELSELVKELEDKFGVSAAAPMMMAGMMAPAAGGAEEEKEEKVQFDCELTSVGAEKIQVIKVVRQFTTLGLKEAKELVEGAPKMLKTGVPKDEADKIKAAFKEVGAEITIK